MNGDHDLLRRLTAADAASPAPSPARMLTAVSLQALLVRRRRRAALIAGGLLCTAFAGAMLFATRPAAASAPDAGFAAMQRQLRVLCAEVTAMRERLDAALAPAAQQEQTLRRERSAERAALAGAQAAALLDATDPAAAARQRAQVVALWPDTAAGRELAAASPSGEHR